MDSTTKVAIVTGAGTGVGKSAALALLKDGFDLVEEDVAEEVFYATVRATYWKADEGSGLRTAAALLIDGLAF